MNKSQIIKELYEATLELESTKDERRRRQLEIPIYELTFILEHWKDRYTKEN